MRIEGRRKKYYIAAPSTHRELPLATGSSSASETDVAVALTAASSVTGAGPGFVFQAQV